MMIPASLSDLKLQGDPEKASSDPVVARKGWFGFFVLWHINSF